MYATCCATNGVGRGCHPCRSAVVWNPILARWRLSHAVWLDSRGCFLTRPRTHFLHQHCFAVSCESIQSWNRSVCCLCKRRFRFWCFQMFQSQLASHFISLLLVAQFQSHSSNRWRERKGNLLVYGNYSCKQTRASVVNACQPMIRLIRSGQIRSNALNQSRTPRH